MNLVTRVIKNLRIPVYPKIPLIGKASAFVYGKAGEYMIQKT